MKKFLNILLAVAGLFSMYWGVQEGGTFAPFMLVSVVAAALNSNYSRNREVACVCVTACSLGSPTSSSGDCAERGGVRRGYWAKYDEIDWTTMLASPLQWDAATQTIKGFTMIGGAVFTPVAHDLKSGEADATFSLGDGFYKNVIKMQFHGQSAANRKVLSAAVGCCSVVFITVGNNCNMRIWGVDFDGTKFSKILTPLAIDKNADMSGTLGGNSKARNEIELAGESLDAPLFLNMAESAIPLV